MPFAAFTHHTSRDGFEVVFTAVPSPHHTSEVSAHVNVKASDVP